MANYTVASAKKVEAAPASPVGGGYAGGGQSPTYSTANNESNRKAWASLPKSTGSSASSMGVVKNESPAAGYNSLLSRSPLEGGYKPTEADQSYLKPGESVRDITPNYADTNKGKNVFVGFDSTEKRPGYSGLTFSDSYRGATQRGVDEDIAAKGLQAGDYKMRVGSDTTVASSQSLADAAISELDRKPVNIAARTWENLKSQYSNPLANPNEIVPSVSDAYNTVWGDTNSVYNPRSEPIGGAPAPTANDAYASPYGAANNMSIIEENAANEAKRRREAGLPGFEFDSIVTKPLPGFSNIFGAY